MKQPIPHFFSNRIPVARALTKSRTGPFIDALIGQTPLLSGLASLTIDRSKFLGMLLFEPIQVSSFQFDYPVFNGESLLLVETERPASAPYAVVRQSFTTERGKLQRHGLAGFADKDELAQSAQAASNGGWTFNLQALLTSQARLSVLRFAEFKRSLLALAPETYAAGLDLTLGAGEEFNSPDVDMRETIREVGETLAAASGITIEDLILYVTNSTWSAMTGNALWKEHAKYASGDNLRANSARMANFIGVREVVIGDSFYKADAAVSSPLISMWGDVAFLKVPAAPAGVWSPGATADNGLVRFLFNEGNFGLPYETKENSTIYFPFDLYQTPAVVSDAKQAIFRNTRA